MTLKRHTHTETGCLIPAEARFYIHRIKPNLVKLSYLRVCVNILNIPETRYLSVVHTLTCAKQKKHGTKLCGLTQGP